MNGCALKRNLLVAAVKDMDAETRWDGVELYGLIGPGGFGREVMPVVREMLKNSISSGECEVVFVAETAGESEYINGHRVISEERFLSCRAKRKYFNAAIADYKIRKKVSEKMCSESIAPFSIKSKTLTLYDGCTIGEGAIFCCNTTVTSNTQIGKFFHANMYSYVAHDCVIGDYVTFAGSVCCSGNVIIEDYAYIGSGAVIRQGTKDKPLVIGKGSIVGMGAIVFHSVQPFTTVIGNPATTLRLG